MPQLRKHYIHGTLVELTFRVEEGLPLVATSYMKLILESYLARAQTLYPIKLCNVIVMGNHIHLHVVVVNPQDVSNFVMHFKKETAWAINSLKGRRGRTVWSPGFDSPIILDAEKALDRLVYLYTNPQKARLVATIEDNPQLSSWREFLSGQEARRLIPCFSRPDVPRLRGTPNKKQSKAVMLELTKNSFGKAELILEPFAWLSCFEETVNKTPAEIIEIVLGRVRQREKEFTKEKGPNVLGTEALVVQSIHKSFQPKKWGKRMACLATEKFTRINYLGWFVDESRKARRAILSWLAHQGPLVLPPGFFGPGRITPFANIFPPSIMA